MALIKDTFFQNVPIEIRDKILYNNNGIGFEKTNLEITINARDIHGRTAEKSKTIKLWLISNLIKMNNIYEWKWDFINYSLVPINMQLEIIDENRQIIAQGKKITQAYNSIPITFRDKINYIPSRKDRIFYRIKLICYNEDWEYYYPSREGVLFQQLNPHQSIKEYTIDGDLRYEYDFMINKIKPTDIVSNDVLEKWIKKLVNPIDDKIYRVNTDEKEKYLLTSLYTAYGELNNFGLNGDKYRFPLKELDHYISKKYFLSAYIDGKKVYVTNRHTDQKLDGLATEYLLIDDIPDNTIVELESFSFDLIDEEHYSARRYIQSEQDMIDIYDKGITIPCDKIGRYHVPDDFILFVRFKNSNHWRRINPYRYKIRINYTNTNKAYSFQVTCLDTYVSKIGNELMIMNQYLLHRMYYKTEMYNKYCEYYQVPCYYVPVSHVGENGEIFTEFMSNVDNENVEVYVNGYRLYPLIDYTIVNMELHQQVPSIFLFKDTLNFGSKIEIVYLDELKNQYAFMNKLEDRQDGLAIWRLDNLGLPPLLQGTFTIFANNRKLNYSQYDIIDSKTLIFKNINTRRNFLLKFHYTDDPYLLQLYNKYKVAPKEKDIQVQLMGFERYISNYVSSHNILPVIDDLLADKYLGLKYIWQLNDIYDYFKEIYLRIVLQPESNIFFQCNNRDAFVNIKMNPILTVDSSKPLPTYFNHDIRINANRHWSIHNYEDNVSFFNPSRTYLAFQNSDHAFKNGENYRINCNNNEASIFDIYMNENIPLIIPYLNNDIEINCNKTVDIDDFKTH